MAKELYYFRKKLGLCTRCGKKAYKNFSLCLDCRDQHNYLNKKYREKLDNTYYKNRYEKNKKYSKENNLCIKCLKNKTENFKICEECRKKIRIRKIKKMGIKYI
jgi:hypothetical protein